MFQAFPLLLLVVLAYNVVALGGPFLFEVPAGDAAESGAQVFSTAALMDAAVFTVTMPSGSIWTFDWGDAFICTGMILLFIELTRSTSAGRTVIMNHALSLGVLVLCLVEFIIVKGFATSTFFLLMLMAAVDVIAGFIISITAARRDLSVSGG